MRLARVAILASLALVLAASSPPASAGHKKDPRSKNLIPVADSEEPGSLDGGSANSDLAFWGNLAFQGSYDGFRIIDISNPKKPKEIGDVDCPGAQGDVSIWKDLLFRSVDGSSTDLCGTAVQMVGVGGIEIFDVSDPKVTGAEDLIAAVPTCGGSHTHTLVPDTKNGRVLVYANPSGGCPAIPIIEVPLDNPVTARVIGHAVLPPDATGCHDIGVHLGVDLAVGACNPNVIVWDIADPASPEVLYTFTHAEVTSWHSGAFTWDGEVIVVGWEPGGGTQPMCQEFNTPIQKSLFFYRASDGELLGSFAFPQAQSALENCTVHNYNLVPHRDRYIVVSSYYQGGTNVVDFTDPANAFQVAWSDPPPLEPAGADGGAWSSYWYNGYIYESDITEGLNVFLLKDPATKQALRQTRLNPQTQDRIIR